MKEKVLKVISIESLMSISFHLIRETLSKRKKKYVWVPGHE